MQGFSGLILSQVSPHPLPSASGFHPPRDQQRVEREQDVHTPATLNNHEFFRFSEAIMMFAKKIRMIFHPMNWISIRQPAYRRFSELMKSFFIIEVPFQLISVTPAASLSTGNIQFL